MSNPGNADTRPVTGTADLVAYMASGCKPATSFTIGTEHEAFGFHDADGSPLAYEGAGGINALLQAIQAREGGDSILDHHNLIGLQTGGASLSLEPGGQFELSGAPLANLHDTQAELAGHIARLHSVTPGLGIGLAPLGFHPTARREDTHWMPKGRYRIMRAYMPKVGTRGLDMMLRTCTVQVNLDFSSQEDMVAKMRVGSALQPLATALFANSPFYEGKANGRLSNRAWAWLDTDNQRAGIPAMIFADGFGFEAYVDWLINDVPMYFVYRDGTYHDVAGASFKDFMAGRLAALPGERATLGDFADHLTTAFPDVRLKKYIETRGADSGKPEMMLAQSALWTGLFYDQTALASAASLIKGISYEQIIALRDAVPTTGLNTPFGTGTLRDLAKDVVAIAAAGLSARARKNADGADERIYLAPLQEIAEGGLTQAEHWLERYHSVWQGDVTHIFNEARF